MYKSFNVDYYKDCINNYDLSHNYNTPIQNNSIKLEVIKKYENDKEYNTIIDNINKKLTSTKKREFISKISEIYELDMSDIIMERLLKKIIPYFEKIYNSHLKVVDLKILKHFKGGHKKGAFLWHFDNHPRSIINIIIYLNDVTENSGGFEYIKMNNKIVKKMFCPPAGNKNMEGFVNNNNLIEIKQMLGKKGTIFYFDNNIVHRAGASLTHNREAILIQVYPSLNKIY